MNYGKAVRIARAIAGLQQKELARRAGLDASHVSLIEKGTRKPSLGAIQNICRALDIPEPVFSMLAAEGEDLRGLEQKDIERLGGHLARLVVGNDLAPKSSRKRKRTERAA